MRSPGRSSPRHRQKETRDDPGERRAGALLGQLLAEIPERLYRIKEGKLFPVFFKHARNLSAVIGLVSLFKVQMIIKRSENLDLGSLIELVKQMVLQL